MDIFNDPFYRKKWRDAYRRRIEGNTVRTKKAKEYTSDSSDSEDDINNNNNINNNVTKRDRARRQSIFDDRIESGGVVDKGTQIFK